MDTTRKKFGTLLESIVLLGTERILNHYPSVKQCTIEIEKTAIEMATGAWSALDVRANVNCSVLLLIIIVIIVVSGLSRSVGGLCLPDNKSASTSSRISSTSMPQFSKSLFKTGECTLQFREGILNSSNSITPSRKAPCR